MDSTLTKEKIQQLLNAVGKRPQDGSLANPNALDYDWRTPKFFTREQLKKIENFGQKIASGLAANFKKLYYCDFEAIVSSVSQHLAGQFQNPADNAKNYFLALTSKDRRIACFSMPSQTAVQWATQLLGDSKSQPSQDKDLSALEITLLYDIASCAARAFSDAFADGDITPVGEITKNKFPLELDPIQDICCITVSVKKPSEATAASASFLVTSESLAAIAGQKQDGNVSPQNVSKALLNHIQAVPVPITVRLADVNLNLQDLMSIQPDDTILLNKKINEPVDVIYNNKIIFRARPAKSEDKYAVVLTEIYTKK